MVQNFTAARGVMGVYVIVRVETGQAYIGSSLNIGERWNGHRGCLRRRAHPNGRLQQAWDEHGEAAFVFAIVERVASLDQLLPREKSWLADGGTWQEGVGYNLTGGARGVGWQRTDEQRARLSAAFKGKPKTAAHRANIWANREVTPEMRAHMAAVGRMGRGKPKAAEHRRKIGEPQRGSGNHRAKLTEIQVIEIKARLAAKAETKRAIAAAFGVHETTIRDIETGRRWGHLTA